MADQDKAGEQRDREGVFGFEQVGKEWREQHGNDGGQRRVATCQQHQQPGADDSAPHGEAERHHGAQRRRHPFATAKMKEDGIHVAKTGGHPDKAEVDRLYLQIPGKIDRRRSLEYIEQQHHQRRQPATEAQHIGGAGVVGAMIPRIRQTAAAGDQHSTG